MRLILPNPLPQPELLDTSFVQSFLLSQTSAGLLQKSAPKEKGSRCGLLARAGCLLFDADSLLVPS
jgi:hypothetical protein